MSNSPIKGPPTAEKGGGGWLLGGVTVVGLVLYLANAGEAETDYGAQEQATPAPVAALEVPAQATPKPSPPLPLNRSALARAVSHVRLATAEEGLDGAMVYSRNCFAALKNGFSWPKLDACAAFDAGTSTYASEEAMSGSPEEAYFQSETSAGRFLALAVAQGLPAAEADQRLADMQSLVTVRLRPARTNTQETVPEPMTNAAADVQVEDSEVEPAEAEGSVDAAGNEIIDDE